MASSQYDLLLCSDTLVSDALHISELLVPIWSSCIVVPGWNAEGLWDGCICVRWIWAFRQPKFECGCCKMLVFRVCGARQNFYVFSLYRNLDLDDRIYDCSLTAMAAVQASDTRTSFLFVGDLTGNHQEWLGSATTNRHGVSALDFATVSGCDQLVIGPTHARGGTLYLLMTNVPDLLLVSVVSPLGSSHHSSLSIAISMAQDIPNVCVSRMVLMKHRVNWSAVCDAIGGLPWRSIWSADNPVEKLNVDLSLLVERFVATKVIRVHNKDKPWLNHDCRLAFDIKQGPISGGFVIALELTGMSLSITRGRPMPYMPRLCVSLVSEAGMF